MRSDEIKVNEQYLGGGGMCLKVLETRIPYSPYRWVEKKRTGVRCEVVRSANPTRRAGTEITLPAREISREWTREDTERFEQRVSEALRVDAIVKDFREKFSVELAAVGGRFGLRMTLDDAERLIQIFDAGESELKYLVSGEEGDSPQIAG